MGHKRHAPTPSPIQMLSIFDARKRGIALPEIAHRTRHSISSIVRWTKQHGHEVFVLEALMQMYPSMVDELKFENHYPSRPTELELDRVVKEVPEPPSSFAGVRSLFNWNK